MTTNKDILGCFLNFTIFFASEEQYKLHRRSQHCVREGINLSDVIILHFLYEPEI